MTAAIAQLSGQEAYDLIYPDYFAKLPPLSQETMQRSMQNSAHVWVGYEDSKVLCTWGLIVPTMLSDRAYLWLYTTEHLQGHEFVFIRYSQRAVEDMLRQYSTIVGHAQVGADRSIRWLRWLGAQFTEPTGQFIPFEIKAKSWPKE